jgi:hypothetical protein
MFRGKSFDEKGQRAPIEMAREAGAFIGAEYRR